MVFRLSKQFFCSFGLSVELLVSFPSCFPSFLGHVSGWTVLLRRVYRFFPLWDASLQFVVGVGRTRAVLCVDWRRYCGANATAFADSFQFSDRAGLARAAAWVYAREKKEAWFVRRFFRVEFGQLVTLVRSFDFPFGEERHVCLAARSAHPPVIWTLTFLRSEVSTRKKRYRGLVRFLL